MALRRSIKHSEGGTTTEGNVMAARESGELGVHDETQVDRIVTTICGGVAKTPEARPAGKPPIGAWIGTTGRDLRTGDVGRSQDSRRSTCHTGSIQH